MTDTSTTARTPQAGSERLGRSSITGHYVLKPATAQKRSVSDEAIRAAVRAVVWRKD